MNQQPNLENFKNWELVRQIPIYFHGIINNYTVSVSDPYENEVLEMLKKNKSHELRKWTLLLKEPMRGHTPESYKRALRKLSTIFEEATDCTEWTLKSAHHLLAFEDSTGQSLFEYDQIVEIGPGIGEVARMLLDAGFQSPYRILDLPEIYRISSYYLSHYPNVSFHNHFFTIPKTNKTLLIGM